MFCSLHLPPPRVPPHLSAHPGCPRPLPPHLSDSLVDHELGLGRAQRLIYDSSRGRARCRLTSSSKSMRTNCGYISTLSTPAILATKSVNSIVLLTNGISFALQAVVLLLVGAWADYGHWRYVKQSSHGASRPQQIHLQAEYHHILHHFCRRRIFCMVRCR